MNKQTVLHFPDDLLFVWDYAHYKVAITKQNESRYSECWNFLINVLAKTVSSVTDLRLASPREEALDFLANEVLHGSRPETITTIGLLKRNFKKYIAKKNNPVQYELDCILRNALHELERKKLIKRESGEINNNICGNTRFALASITIPESETADWAAYEVRKNKIPRYTVKVRANDWAKTKIIPPATACELILHLLKAFGGWTCKKDLLAAINNHIPEQLTVVGSETITQNDNDSNPSDNIVDECSEFFIYEHDVEHAQFNANGLSRAIWDNICQVSDKSFCLYFLPVHLYCRTEITQSAAGESRRVSEDCKKLSSIFSAHLKHFNELSLNHKQITQSIKNVFYEIRQNLSGKCTEKGYSPHLYSEDNVDL